MSTPCLKCGNYPQYCDATTGQLHSYCSKSCANSGVSVCSTPGCSKPVFKDVKGKASKYCSKAHIALGERGCLNCRTTQRAASPHFCQPCQGAVQGNAPMILEVPEEHVTFQSVASQFKTSWKHDTPCPTVRAVYKVISTQQNLDKYETYRASVEARGQFINLSRSAGNENRRWHGTGRQCNLGDKGCTQFCSSTTCSLCCIVRTTYDLKLVRKTTGWGRFGAGIYTSSTSSKSNDYSRNMSSSPWKAILLNRVVVGKGYKIMSDSPTMMKPPSGYDSVLGEVGLSLNHDELIVYRSDAVRPSYLVMYDK